MFKILVLGLLISTVMLHKLADDEFDDLFETTQEEEEILKQ